MKTQRFLVYQETIEKQICKISLVFNFCPDKFLGAFYYGKQSKPLWRYRFKSLYEMLNYADKYFKKYTERIESNAKNKEIEKKAAKSFKVEDFVKVGTILYNSWGWEQTNVNFYRVEEIKGRSLFCVELCQDVVDYCSSMSEHVVPNEKIYKNGEQIKINVSPLYYSFENKITPKFSVKEKNFYHIDIWDGKKKYSSSYA